MADADYSLEDWMNGISRAERNGDTAAATRLRARAAAALTGTGSVTERIGAGAQDVLEAGKRWAGGSAEDYKEHQRIAKQADPGGWGRMAGQALATAPVALIPGVNTIAGGAISGGALGGFMEPDDPLKGAAVGGAAGAGLAGLFKALPMAWQAGKEQIAKRTPWLKDTKQDIAERAFTDVVPAAERAATQAELAANREVIPGFQQTAGGASGNRQLLATERQLRDSGSPHGDQLRQRVGDQGAALDTALESGLGGGKSAAAKAGRETYSAAEAPTTFPRKPKPNRDFGGVLEAFESELADASGAQAAKLEQLRTRFFQALEKAQETRNVAALHKWRRAELNDAITTMSREGAPQTAVITRDSLHKVKQAFDSEMDRILARGKGAGTSEFSDFMGGYHSRSRDISQAKAGEEMLAKFAEKPAMPATGGARDPAGMMGTLRKEFAAGQPVSEFGTPKYSGSGETLLRDSLAELERANAGYAANVGPRNSATAANMQPFDRVLKQATDAKAALTRPFSLKDLGAFGTTGSAIGGMVGNVPGAAVGGFVGHGIDRAVAPARAAALEDIAQRMLGMFADPQKAAQAIANASIPPAEKALLLQFLERYAVAGAGASSGDQVMPTVNKMTGSR